MPRVMWIRNFGILIEQCQWGDLARYAGSLLWLLLSCGVMGLFLMPIFALRLISMGIDRGCDVIGEWIKDKTTARVFRRHDVLYQKLTAKYRPIYKDRK